MKILVAGATGNTGIRLMNKLIEQRHDPIALVRESSNTDDLPVGSEQRLGDLADLPDDICDGCDAVVFAAGSGSDTDADTTDKIDRDGAIRLIDLAAKSKVQRFVMLSSVGAGDPDLDSKMGHYLKAKHDADEHLKASGLSYAIIRPVALTNGDGTEDMRFGDEVEIDGEAARGDVAAVLADAVESDAWTDKTERMESV